MWLMAFCSAKGALMHTAMAKQSVIIVLYIAVAVN